MRPERHYAFPGVSIAMMVGVALGAARGAVDSLLELLEAKVDRRSGRLAAAAFDRQMDLAAAEALTGSARAYLYQALEELWAAVMAGEEPGLRLRAQYRLACNNAVNSSCRQWAGPTAPPGPARYTYRQPWTDTSGTCMPSPPTPSSVRRPWPTAVYCSWGEVPLMPGF